MARSVLEPVVGERPLEIVRDEYGVAQVRSRTEADAYRGLGYCHATDRALQLLLTRILFLGRACELLEDSEQMLEYDRFFRRAGFGIDADVEVARLAAEDRALLDAYCDGINQALAKRTPWELRLLRYRPEAWRMTDSIALSRVMNYVQVAQHQADMERLLVEMVQAGTPVPLLEELFPDQLGGLDAETLMGVRLGQRMVPEGVRWSGLAPQAGASNNWVIAPDRTASGRTIMASDPHLEANRLPAIWYETVLEQEDRFWMGASIPGLPFIAIGRNDSLAWSATYACLDAVDSWVEDCRDGRHLRRVEGKEKWIPFRPRSEVIKRKKHDDLEVTFFENDHGVLDGDPREPGLYLATRWSAARSGARSLAAGMEVARAETVPAGMETLGRIETAWNWVLADGAGEIGYQMSGTLPLRRAGWSGLVPVAGWEPANDWQGFAIPEELPRARAREGFIATANDDQNRHGRRKPVNLPMGSERGNRIRELLRTRSDWSVPDLVSMQMDVVSRHAERYLDALRSLLPQGSSARTLASWDCRYDVDSRGASLFEGFYRRLLHEVFGRRLGRDVTRFLAEETAIFAGFYANFDEVLLNPESGWFGEEGQAGVFRRVATESLQEPAARWGERQRFTMKHLMFGERLLGRLGFNYGPIELRGGRATIHQGQVFQLGGRETNWAPSYRFVTDLGRSSAETALAGGPSDRPFSRLYKTGIGDWVIGRTKTLSAAGLRE